MAMKSMAVPSMPPTTSFSPELGLLALTPPADVVWSLVDCSKPPLAVVVAAADDSASLAEEDSLSLSSLSSPVAVADLVAVLLAVPVASASDSDLLVVFFWAEPETSASEAVLVALVETETADASATSSSFWALWWLLLPTPVGDRARDSREIVVRALSHVKAHGLKGTQHGVIAGNFRRC